MKYRDNAALDFYIFWLFWIVIVFVGLFLSSCQSPRPTVNDATMKELYEAIERAK